MGNVIYLDNAATTAVYPEVFEKMRPFFCEQYGNASSIYQFGGIARKAQEEARRIIAKSLNAEPEEIYFTSGGSEADNWALIGAAEAFRDKRSREDVCGDAESKGNEKQYPGHIITTKIEHHAVLNTCKYLEKQGIQITYLDVDSNGLVDITRIERAIRPDTFLISVMLANNEIGTIQPVSEIGSLAKKHNILFHTDAVQGYGHIPVDVERCNIDLLSASGHKFHGPKGIGFLYIRKNVKMGAFIHGGAQERGRRAGTVNIPGIVGMGEAARIAMENMETNSRKICGLRDYLIKAIEKEIPGARLNGHPSLRLPNNVNFSFEGIQGESLLIQMDMNHICASSGSACAAGSLDPAYVLLALGLSGEDADSSLRLTLSEENTIEELDYTVRKIKEIVIRLREICL